MIKIIVWGKLAEYCAEHLKKKDKIAIAGYLKSRKVDLKETVEDITITEVVAMYINFLDEKL